MSEAFKRRVLQLSLNMTDIRGAVRDFEKVIQSRRRSSCMNSFEDLVTVLIKRDWIDPNDETTWVKLNDMCSKYCGQPFYLPLRPVVNETSRTHQEPLQNADLLLPGRIPLLHPSSPIVKYLLSRIGISSWRNFARGLNIPEGEIKKIETNPSCNGSEMCVKAVLRYYEENLLICAPRGNAIEGISLSLKLLQRDYLIAGFQNVVDSLSDRH